MVSSVMAVLQSNKHDWQLLETGGGEREKKEEDLIQSWPGLTCRFPDFEIMVAYLK